MKKGFTLIELLAVILILGIIAIIAIPSVNYVITQSKKGAAEASVRGFIKAVNNKISTSRIDASIENIEDGTYDVTDSKIQVELQGSYPTSGSVVISDGEVINASIVLSNYTVTCDVETCNAVIIEKGKEKEEEQPDKYLYFAETGTDLDILSFASETMPEGVYAFLKIPMKDNKRMGSALSCVYDYAESKEICISRDDVAKSRQTIIDYFGFNKTDWTNTDGHTWRKSRTEYCSITDTDITCSNAGLGLHAGFDRVYSIDYAWDLYCLSDSEFEHCTEGGL